MTPSIDSLGGGGAPSYYPNENYLGTGGAPGYLKTYAQPSKDIDIYIPPQGNKGMVTEENGKKLGFLGTKEVI